MNRRKSTLEVGTGHSRTAATVCRSTATPAAETMVEKAQLRAPEGTFRGFHPELFFTEYVEDLSDVSQVSLQCRTKAEEVVHVDDD